MRERIKRLMNTFFQKTVKHRLVHELLATDAMDDVWRSLANQGFRPQQIVDIGAARGLWTKEIVNIFPAAKFFMVDPLNENKGSLQAVVDGRPNVAYWIGAIGRQNGEIELQVHSDQTSMFSSEWKGSVRKVPLRTLDSFLADGTITRMDALKIDVQGAELEVLHGSKNLLEQCTAVQLEVSFRRVYEKAPLAHEIVVFFAEKGFRLYDISGTYKRPADRALIQADFFFVSGDQFFCPETYHG
jgi:FkbM family methyltransferase